MDKFKIEQNGYSINEVNKFVDDVITQTENMLVKMKKLNEENDELKKQIERYKESERNLTGALYKAEEIGSSIKNEAYKERNTIIEDARRNASRIINDALLRAEKIEFKTETLEKNLRVYKRKLRLALDEQLSIVDELDEIKME